MKMFNLIGIGERAGSGVPDIYSVIAYVLIVLASAVPLLHGRRARARRCCGLKGK